ncbi:MAG TPA: squalene/phytoene synthase family protein [Chthoniobacterales bacterium]|nr:squalene/phytoene synthase family protein [Chthoniobacterales bacterium]
MNAAKITRESKSNLALAFVSLGRERRRDITTFYAFCRLIDDVADDLDLHVEEKKRRLTLWRESLHGSTPGEPSLAHEIRRLMEKYSLGAEMLAEIIAGVEMDLTNLRYATFAQLRVYCYRVASAVGLVSIEIFGYRNPTCKKYAIELGFALQMTNIIRDVEKDLRRGRIYLPQEDLDRLNYSETELQDRQYNERFIQLMRFEAQRAEDFFARAAALLPPEDRQSMVAAEIMAAVYHALLRRMQADEFRVFEEEYRLTKLEKARHIATQLIKHFLNLRNATFVGF